MMSLGEGGADRKCRVFLCIVYIVRFTLFDLSGEPRLAAKPVPNCQPHSVSVGETGFR